ISVHQLLELRASSVISFHEKKSKKSKIFPIRKAVIFPFNKEIHSVVTNTDLCKFEIFGVYDTKYLGNVNKKISNILTYSQNNNI
ncbi:hypothetical protein, partial [Enterobacter hormaechei]